MFKKTMPHDIQSLIELYNYTASGYWFSKGTMAFFKSKVTGDFKRLSDDEALFISSEKGPADSPRRYTVRKATLTHTEDDGIIRSKINIDTIGPFNELTLHKARKLMGEY